MTTDTNIILRNNQESTIIVTVQSCGSGRQKSLLKKKFTVLYEEQLQNGLYVQMKRPRHSDFLDEETEL